MARLYNLPLIYIFPIHGIKNKFPSIKLIWLVPRSLGQNRLIEDFKFYDPTCKGVFLESSINILLTCHSYTDDAYKVNNEEDAPFKDVVLLWKSL